MTRRKAINLSLAAVVAIMNVGCVPFIQVEIQNTQRTNSEATKNSDEIDSPQLGSTRSQHKPTSHKLNVDAGGM